MSVSLSDANELKNRERLESETEEFSKMIKEKEDTVRKHIPIDTAVVLYDLLFLFDFVAAYASAYAATALYRLLAERLLSGDNLFLPDFREVLIYACLTPFTLRDSLAGGDRLTLKLTDVVRRLGHRLPTFVGVILFAGYAMRLLDDAPRVWLSTWAIMTFGLALLARLVLARRMSAWKASGRLREVIAIIGTGKAADRLRDEITQRDGSAVEVVGVYDDRQTRKASDCAEPDGTIGDLLELGKHRHIDRILVTLPWSAEKRLLEILRTLKNLAVEVALAPPDFGLRLPQRSIDFLSDLPIMVVADRPLRRWSLLLKMAEDKLLAALLLVFLGPLMALTALAIRIDSPGPILFRQERVGWNNKTFWVFKFRTMTWDPGASRQIQQTRRNDSRVTRLGGFLRKTSLDELPQILNVLRGEMSLVGPRPHAVSMRTENMLGDEIVAEYANRHRVRPGITGWAQVNGYRGATEHADQLRKRVEFDLHYIENWSVLFDVKILVMTIITVFARENAF